MTLQQDLLFAFGLGYSAETLGRRLIAAGWRVAGTVRSEDKAERLRAVGFEITVWDGSEDISVPEGAHWLISAPPGDLGCPAFLAAQNPETAASITYLSTTGVYGDLGGNWAYEWTPVNPQSDRARRRVLAELQWQSVAGAVAIVRLPGIYGPGRSAFARLRGGQAKRIVKPGQVFSRIHVDDIASGLEARLQRPETTGVLHLCDDYPAPPQDVIAHAAELIGVDIPPDEPFETAELSDMARSFYSECKRIANGRTKSVLGWSPEFANYHSGLAAILAAESA
ncbi:MAG: SDR family oxidoreductase [Pseudomonadota bacterium]